MIVEMYYLYCNECGREYNPPSEGKESLIEFSKKRGWIEIESISEHINHCPECVEKLKVGYSY